MSDPLKQVQWTVVAYGLARIDRDKAIQAAIQAGVPRPKIAEVSGLSKSRIDQIGRGYSCRAINQS